MDRLDQVQDQLSPEEISILEAVLIQMGGNSQDQLGLLDALRWWSLGSHQPTGLNEIALHTRPGSGNSELHRRIFDHDVSTNRLACCFDAAITQIEHSSGLVTIKTRDGWVHKAKGVICNIPLDVLSSVRFDPPLPLDKQEAIRKGSVNKGNKVHLDIEGPDLSSWSPFRARSSSMVCAFGDNNTPSGTLILSHLDLQQRARQEYPWKTFKRQRHRLSACYLKIYKLRSL